MKLIWLLVEVTNFPAPEKLAEDAHQAELNVTIPEALTYSGVRSEVCPLESSRGQDELQTMTIEINLS